MCKLIDKLLLANEALMPQTNLIPNNKKDSMVCLVESLWYIGIYSLRLIEIWRNNYCRLVLPTITTTLFQIVRKKEQVYLEKA